MITSVFEKTFSVADDKLDIAWERLNRRESFVDGQIFPYKVEFDAVTQQGPFEEGELNIHHGPFLSVHGRIGEISRDYRGLEYFYGSYVISFRLIRPVKLEFFREEYGIRLVLTAFVNPAFEKVWLWGNRKFWRFAGISFLWR